MELVVKLFTRLTDMLDWRSQLRTISSPLTLLFFVTEQS